MFEVNEILRKTEAGSVPASWRVFKSPRSFPITRGLQATGLALLAFILAPAIAQSAGLFHLSAPLWWALLSAAPVVGVLVGGFIAMQMKYMLLVVTPDGFVQRTSKASRSIFAVAYQDLEAMKIDVDARWRNRYACGTIEDPYNNRSRQKTTTLKLHLTYPDKREMVWQMDKRFGDSLDIVPSLNEGYVQYFALKNVWNKQKRARLAQAE